MSESDQNKSEKEIFMRALELPAEARGSYLNEACGGDEALKRDVQELLAAHGNSDVMEETVRNDTTTLKAADDADEQGDRQIGRYKLLEKLGEGGFGTVWAAEQKEPVKRRVALKIIKLGMDTKQVVARFEAERQALALMDHPNIAKVLDAGSTDTGRPYFVMELVKGIPITRYCEQEKLDTEARLDLFIKVCHAIQHAHQKGVIHRDIKPSNIMVTLHDGVPVPKVIDFGIAKATQRELSEKTIYTQYSQFIGTPAYMSPEQAEMSGLDIDTRSDIYSLGVLLYELLTGTTPFDTKELMQSGLDEMRKIIREREPVRPSTRVSQTLSENAERTAPRVQRSTLPSDLDWIVMKCLEKDRSRRYETANGLAADINRHRYNEPIGARPPSAAYKFQKAWRRNKSVYTAGAAVALALIIGLSGSLWQMGVARRAEKVAERNLLAKTETEAELNATLVKERALKTELVNLTRGLQAKEADLQDQLYYTDMNLAGHAMKESSGLVRLDRLTSEWMPKPGDSEAEDPRGWEWYYLRSRLHQDVRTIDYETSGQTWVVWGKDGCYQFDMAGDDLTVTRIGISPREKDLRVRRLSLESEGKSVQAWKPSPDGEWVAVATSGGGIEIWDWRKGEVKTRLDGGSEETQWLFWSQDSKRLAGLGDDENLRFWDISDRHAHLKLGWDDQSPSYIHWEAGGDRIGIAAGVTFQLWDPLKKTLSLPPLDTRYWFWRGAWSPSGDRIALADLDGFQIRIYDAQTWEPRQSLDGTFGPALCLAWSPDGRYLAAGGADQILRVWDTKSDQSKPTHEFSGHVRGLWSIRWDPSGEYLLSMGGSHVFKIWRFSEGKIEKTPYGSRLLNESVGQLFLGWSADGHSFVTTDGAQILIWNATTRQIMSRLNGLEQLLADPEQELTMLDLEVSLRVAWSPHSDHVAVGLSSTANPIMEGMFPSGRTIHIFKGSTGEREQVLRGEILSGDKLEWNPVENIIAAAHGDKVVFWDPETGEAVDSWSWRDGYITSLAWNPDGIRLAVASSAINGSTNHQIRVLNTQTMGTVVMASTDHPDQTFVGGLSWDRDGRRLIACHRSTLGAFHMWDGDTGELKQVFRGHAHGVDSIAWSADGGRIVSGSKDSTVRVWDPESGRETLTLTGFPALPYIFWRPGEGHDHSFLTQMTFKPGYEQYLWDASQGYREEERRLATFTSTRLEKLSGGKPTN